MNELKKVIKIYTMAVVLVFAIICIAYKAGSQEKIDSIKDINGNTYKIKLMSGSKIWITDNLKINIPASYCYENAAQYCKQYGRLYTWKAAQQGCLLLGIGWRLPSRDEWRQLIIMSGSDATDSTLMRKQAYQSLLSTGGSGFNALLGGGRETNADKYSRLEAHGFYWTATDSDSTSAYYYNFAKGSQALFEQDGGEKTRAFSVRCVKE